VVERGYWPFAWLDMGWEEYRVSVEYDGDQHRKDRPQYVRDHRRQRRLEALGWINIRVIKEDAPSDVIRRVTDAMRSRGWQP
jgi:very-short-patch-repair endonuclease